MNMGTFQKVCKYKEKDCPIGWVDIRTVARVPLRFVVYLKKSRENYKKLVF
jgi:hypothetical protein